MPTKNCSKCHWGYLRPSNTWMFWHKCPICGFTVLDLDLIHPQDHERAKANPLALTSEGLSNQSRVEKPNAEYGL